MKSIAEKAIVLNSKGPILDGKIDASKNACYLGKIAFFKCVYYSKLDWYTACILFILRVVQKNSSLLKFAYISAIIWQTDFDFKWFPVKGVSINEISVAPLNCHEYIQP